MMLAVALGVVVAWVVWMLRCRHYDASGSWLIWTHDAHGRRVAVCGRCWRHMRGW